MLCEVSKDVKIIYWASAKKHGPRLPPRERPGPARSSPNRSFDRNSIQEGAKGYLCDSVRDARATPSRRIAWAGGPVYIRVRTREGQSW